MNVLNPEYQIKIKECLVKYSRENDFVFYRKDNGTRFIYDKRAALPQRYSQLNLLDNKLSTYLEKLTDFSRFNRNWSIKPKLIPELYEYLSTHMPDEFKPFFYAQTSIFMDYSELMKRYQKADNLAMVRLLFTQVAQQESAIHSTQDEATFIESIYSFYPDKQLFLKDLLKYVKNNYQKEDIENYHLWLASFVKKNFQPEDIAPFEPLLKYRFNTEPSKELFSPPSVSILAIQINKDWIYENMPLPLNAPHSHAVYAQHTHYSAILSNCVKSCQKFYKDSGLLKIIKQPEDGLYLIHIDRNCSSAPQEEEIKEYFFKALQFLNQNERLLYLPPQVISDRLNSYMTKFFFKNNLEKCLPVESTEQKKKYKI